MAQTTQHNKIARREPYQYYLGFDNGGTKCAAILAAVPADTGPGEEAALLPGIVDRQVFATRDAAVQKRQINA